MCYYAECRYAECHYAEGRGTKNKTNKFILVLSMLTKLDLNLTIMQKCQPVPEIKVNLNYQI